MVVVFAIVNNGIPIIAISQCPTESSTLLPYVNATIRIKMLYPSDWKRVIDSKFLGITKLYILA